MERILLILTFICSVLAFTFGIGVNWARVTAHEAMIEVLQQTTVPRELYNADQRYLAASIDRLTKALDMMRAEQVERDRRLRNDLR